MKNLPAGPALFVAGAAVGAAAAWLGNRTSKPSANKPHARRAGDTSVSASHGELGDSEQGGSIGPESGELPVGHSADPEIDRSLTHGSLAIDETSGASLFGEPEPPPRYREPPLDDIWNALPGMAEGEQTEGYDAVEPEDLGSVWLGRATQTTHEHRPHASDPHETPDLEDFSVSEASRSSAATRDDDEIRDEDLDIDEDVIDDDLDNHRRSER